MKHTCIEYTDATTGHPMVFSINKFVRLEKKEKDFDDVTYIHLDGGITVKSSESMRTLQARIDIAGRSEGTEELGKQVAQLKERLDTHIHGSTTSL